MPAFKDLSGAENQGVKVIKHEKSINGKHYWRFVCKHCGAEFVSCGADFSYGRIQSCGCIRNKGASKRATQRNYKHGGRKTRLYTIWKGMKQRCGNAKAPNYSNYGGRGITVCEEWATSFEAFRE